MAVAAAMTLVKSVARWCDLVAASLFLCELHGAAAVAESSVVIERCSVFDPESGQMLPERTIVDWSSPSTRS